MKKIITGFSTVGLTMCVLGAGTPPGYGCSTFFLEHGEQMVFGRNLDWHTQDGLVIVNKRGVSKTARIDPPDKPAAWVSRYGSITFNQVGREFPFGGINETGLVVEQMWLSETVYPAPDERLVLGELQWIQYQLDNFSTVKEVIGSNGRIRIGQSGADLHFLVCDRSGDAAAIEFLNGKMVCHTGKDLPVKALTNTRYSRLLASLRSQTFSGAGEIFAFLSGSGDRFSRMAGKIKEYEAKPSTPIVAYAFSILDNVSQGSYTKWSIVYDVGNMEIHFKTQRSKKKKLIRLNDFDFDCATAVKVLDIDINRSGDVGKHFVDYHIGINRKLIRSVFRQYEREGFKRDIPPDRLEQRAQYPETLPCQPKKENR